MLRNILLSIGSLCLSATVIAAPEVANKANPAAWGSIKHVVYIVLENQPASAAEKQPYMKSLMAKGAYFTNFFAQTHPSQPNYITMVAGDQLNVTTNSNVNLDDKHIGDLFDAQCLTWKVYAEDLPLTTCYTGTTSGYYARRHEPFISFKSVQSNPEKCKNIQNASQFFKDIAANNLPTYSFYVPNNRNNGHDTSIAFADTWLKNTFDPLFTNPNYLKDTLFIVTFDEDDGSQNNRIYTLFLGAGVKVGTVSNAKNNFFTLMRTIEDMYGLGTLGKKDQTALPITDVWTS